MTEADREQLAEYLDESEVDQEAEGEDDEDYVPDDELAASDVKQEVEIES